jgi:prophage DNA circulation protein
MVDILKDLQECSFRGIPFPIQMIKESGSQDLVVHKKADRDGAFVEATGLNPFQYQIRAVFINGIARGPKETWDDLFPNTFLKVRDAYRDRSNGLLNHPLYGQILVKPVNFENTIEADSRNGVYLDLAFTESSEISTLQPSSSAVSLAKQSARDLDQMFAQLNPPPETFFPEGDYNSLEDFVNDITSVVDQAQLVQQQVLGKIAQVGDKLNKISSRIDTAAQVISTDPITQIQTDLGPLGNGISNITQSSRTLNLALFEISQKALSQNKGVQVYTVPSNTTIVSIALALRNKASELISLNPSLAGRLFINREEKLKYYEKL